MKLLKKLYTGFIRIFQAPADIHRVIVAGVLGVLSSHVFYLIYESKIPYILTKDQKVLASIMGVLVVFALCWSIFSSELNIILYGRQIVVIGWVILGHRIFYGVETLGSLFVSIMLFLGWTIWIPFALAEVKPGELIDKVRNWQDKRKKPVLAVVEREEERKGVYNV